VKAVTGCVKRRPDDLRVRCERVPEDARAGEERDPDTPADELLADDLDRVLSRMQAVGLEVADRHALRYVESDDRVDG